MPRRNKNVRHRNVPRAAQEQRRTEGTQLKVRDHRPYSRQPSAQDRADLEYAAVSTWLPPSAPS